MIDSFTYTHKKNNNTMAPEPSAGTSGGWGMTPAPALPPPSCRTRKGLLALRQNVVLLRDPEDPDKFYPVRSRC